MSAKYPVHVDRKGYVLIPSDVRKALGLEAQSLLILTVEGEELRLQPAEVVPRRRIREISRDDLAQGLIDSAVTAKGKRAAQSGIEELGLDPKKFKSRF